MQKYSAPADVELTVDSAAGRVAARHRTNSNLGGRRHRQPARNAELVDETLHHTTRFRILHEVPQPRLGRGTGGLGANRLLNRRELPVEDPGTGQPLDIGEQAWPQCGKRLEPFVHKQLQ